MPKTLDVTFATCKHTSVPARKPKRLRPQVMMTIDPDVLAEVKKIAKRYGSNVSKFTETALVSYMRRKDAAELTGAAETHGLEGFPS